MVRQKVGQRNDNIFDNRFDNNYDLLKLDEKGIQEKDLEFNWTQLEIMCN